MRKDQKRGRQFAENTLKDKKNSGASNQDNSPAVNSSRQQEVPLDNGQWSSVAPKGPGSFERSSEHMGNGQCISTYSFLDNGCTDTSIDSQLPAHPNHLIHCSFVMRKATNAAVMFVSIPRLELQATVLSAQLNQMLRKKICLSNARSTKRIVKCFSAT